MLSAENIDGCARMLKTPNLSSITVVDENSNKPYAYKIQLSQKINSRIYFIGDIRLLLTAG